MDEERKDEVTPEELEETDGEPLPDREAMSIISPDVNLPPVALDPDPVPTLPVEPPEVS